MRSLVSRVSPIYAVFVAASAAQVGLLVATGVVSDFHLTNLIPLAVLIVLLGRRSRVAWWLLVAVDAIPLLWSTTLWGPGTLWLHVVLFAMGGSVLLVLLVCRPMREFVSVGRTRRPARARAR